MTIAWRIHFSDDYGQATIETDKYENFRLIYHKALDNPDVDDVWVEYLDDEEGWQA